MEHLNRKVQMRVQIQKPFEFCDGHNVLRSAAASFSEEIERMVSDACVLLNEGRVRCSQTQSDRESFHVAMPGRCISRDCMFLIRLHLPQRPSSKMTL